MAAASEAMNEFGLEVLRALRRDKLPPLPEYFELYFNEILLTKPQDLRKEAVELSKYGYASDPSFQIVNLETKLKEHSRAIKEILNSLGNVHKQFNRSFQVFNKYVTDASNLTSPSAAQNLTLMLKNDVSGLVNFINTQTDSFKTIYQKSTDILKTVEEESIFDLVYGVFNKKYLLAQIIHEQMRIQHLGHASTLIIIKPSKSLDISSEKTQLIVNKTIAKILMKNARKSDIVSFLGNSTFAILLRHKDIQNASKACERYYEVLLGSNFFIGDKEIELKVHSGISTIEHSVSIEELLDKTIEKMEQADENDLPFCTGA